VKNPQGQSIPIIFLGVLSEVLVICYSVFSALFGLIHDPIDTPDHLVKIPGSGGKGHQSEAERGIPIALLHGFQQEQA